MKILQVISSFPPAFSYGGALNVAFGISKELVKKNHDVTVYTTDVYDANSRLNYTVNPELMEGIKVFHFRNISNSLARKNLSCAPTMFFSLKNTIKIFDVIHIHEYRSFQAIFVHYYAKKYCIPYIVQAHGAVLPVFEKQWLKKIFDAIWGNTILKDASKVIALTKTEVEQYQIMGIPKNKICIIPNGINLSEFQNLPNKGEFRKKFHIQNNDDLILYIGRLHKTKGLDLLIDAFYELNKTTKSVRLLIAGPDDGYLSVIVNKIQELNLQNEVLVIGFISTEEKIQAFIDSDVFVLPSYSGFPVTILEACACSLPIITTNKGDVLEWIDNNIGFVVDYDKDHLCDKIHKILTDEQLKKKFGDEGKKLIVDRYNWTKIVSDIERTYESIAEEF